MTPMPLRFTIRDLLWLTLVVALAVGWWVDRSNLTRQSNGWRDMFNHQLEMIEGLQEYFHEKHPNESIDWAQLRQIHAREESR